MNKPIIGVGVIVRKDDMILLGKRTYDEGPDTWCFPGGHLDFNEKAIDSAIREVKEETNLSVNNISFLTYTDDFFYETKQHFVTLVFVADYDGGRLVNKEKENFESWKWFSWTDLPSSLALPLKNVLDQKINPFIRGKSF